jgi:hypothetical protein
MLVSNPDMSITPLMKLLQHALFSTHCKGDYHLLDSRFYLWCDLAHTQTFLLDDVFPPTTDVDYLSRSSQSSRLSTLSAGPYRIHHTSGLLLTSCLLSLRFSFIGPLRPLISLFYRPIDIDHFERSQ